MQFKFFTFATVLMTAGSVLGAAQITPSDVVNDLTQLTSTVTNANVTMQQLTLLNTILQVPASIAGLTSILTEIAELEASLNLANGTLSIASTVDQTQICDALTILLTAYQDLTSTLQSKLSILTNLELGTIVAAALSTALIAIHSFVSGVVMLVPTCGAGPASELASLEATLTTAIKALGGTVPALP